MKVDITKKELDIVIAALREYGKHLPVDDLESRETLTQAFARFKQMRELLGKTFDREPHH